MGRKKKTDEGGGREPSEAQGGVSKVDAVRAVLAEGHDTPLEGVAAVKARFGIEMTPQHFSTTKSNLKKREGKSGGRRGRRAAGGKQVTSGSGAGGGANGEQDVLAALEAIKPLVGQFGADRVRRMVDLMGD